MKKKPTKHSLCTIRRTVKVTHYRVNMATGKRTKGRSEIVTEPCGVPLFSDEHRRTGVCDSCAKGWDVEGNRFANAKEKARATGGKA